MVQWLRLCTPNACGPGFIPGQGTSLGAQLVKDLPAMQETGVQFLGWEDLLEEGMATHSSILSWSIPMNKGAWRATIHRFVKQLEMT